MSVWPMCRAPVTFGGGITITNFSFVVLLSARQKF
jgi:hypothetical protein